MGKIWEVGRGIRELTEVRNRIGSDGKGNKQFLHSPRYPFS